MRARAFSYPCPPGKTPQIQFFKILAASCGITQERFILNSSLLLPPLLPQNGSLPLCPATPPNLTGPIEPIMDILPMSELELRYPNIELGGRGYPRNCLAQQKLAIVIPYR